LKSRAACFVEQRDELVTDQLVKLVGMDRDPGRPRFARYCWADDYVINEARRNLNLKGPGALSAFETVLALLHVRTLHASAPAFEDINWLPAKDQPVLIAAARLHCDVLVTGDRTHLGPGYGKTFRGVTIHSPRSLAELLFT